MGVLTERLRAQRAHRCTVCGDPIPRRRKRYCVECSVERNRETIAENQRRYYERNREPRYCHRCGGEIAPKRGRPPRLCPTCRQKA